MAPRNMAIPGTVFSMLRGLDIPAAFRSPKSPAGAGLTPPDPESALLNTPKGCSTAQQAETVMREYTQRVARFRIL